MREKEKIRGRVFEREKGLISQRRTEIRGEKRRKSQEMKKGGRKT